MNPHRHNVCACVCVCVCMCVSSSLLKIGRCPRNTQLTQITINKPKSKESACIIKYARSWNRERLLILLFWATKVLSKCWYLFNIGEYWWKSNFYVWRKVSTHRYYPHTARNIRLIDILIEFRETRTGTAILVVVVGARDRDVTFPPL